MALEQQNVFYFFANNDIDISDDVKKLFDMEIFIDMVKEEPCIWNTSLRSFREQPKKKLAWQKIAEVLLGENGLLTLVFKISVILQYGIC